MVNQSKRRMEGVLPPIELAAVVLRLDSDIIFTEVEMPKESPKQRTERLALYQSYMESGQAITEFSRERGTSYWRVKSAIRKTEAEQKRGGGSFQEVSLPVLGGGEYSVTLRNGRELRIPGHFSEKRVRQLIEIIESC